MTFNIPEDNGAKKESNIGILHSWSDCVNYFSLE